jgi:hypothetical protein
MAIGRTNRAWLEARGLRFAPRDLADLFAAERAGDLNHSFGYHGVFNMPRALGADRFWDIYCQLTDRSTLGRNMAGLLKDMWKGPSALPRSGQMAANHLLDIARRKIS